MTQSFCAIYLVSSVELPFGDFQRLAGPAQSPAKAKAKKGVPQREAKDSKGLTRRNLDPDLSPAPVFVPDQTQTLNLNRT